MIILDLIRLDLDCYVQRIHASISAHYYLWCLSFRHRRFQWGSLQRFFLRLLGYTLVLRAQAAFLMYPCGSGAGSFNSFTPMGADSAHLFHKLRASVITFPNFDHWQHLIAKNAAELSSSNRSVSHLNEACRIDELSRGLALGLKFSQTTSDWNVQ